MARTTLPCGPFARSMSAVEAHLLPQDAMSSLSLNMLVDPIRGGVYKRPGFEVYSYGETLNGLNRATVGILQSSIGWVPARLRAFYSDAAYNSVAYNNPVPSVLYRREASDPTWPAIDDGVFGTDVVRRSNSNYQLLSEFGGQCYPTGGGAHGAEIKYKVVPFWYESGEGGYSRGSAASTDFTQRFVCSGSWGSVDVGRHRYYPNLRGTPLRWDGGMNESPTSISNAIRVTPTGPFAPLWAPTVATGTSGGVVVRSPTYPWLGGDRFYVSVMGRRRDGSYTLPTYPVLVTVNSAALTTAYTHINYENIPIMDDDIEARVVLRSLKQTITATTDALTVSLNDMRVVGTLRNNTQTTYKDIESSDNSLLQDTDAVRWDLICPPRARHIGTGDQRVLVGYTLPNPSAIQLSCIGIGAAYDQNLADTSASISGATSACYRVTSTGIDLIVAAAGAALATTTVDWATYTTVKAVVDQINTTTRDATHGQWRAQVAPGADPFAPSTGLCPTYQLMTSGTATCPVSSDIVTITDTAEMAAIPIGSKVYDSAGKISAGTYVVKKLTSTTLQLSAPRNAIAGACATNLGFYSDCGDEACVTTAGSKGWIRTFGSAYPGMVYFKRSALPGYDKPAKERIYFTISSPGAAATGVSLAANAWAATNRRDGLGQTGQVMGIVDVQGAAIIAYRDKIGIFENQRGSNTGEDFDYRIFPVNNSMGCCSPWSVVGVAGCAVYATPVGIKAADKSRKEVLLSEDEFQPSRMRGNFAYEIAQCVGAAGADSPDCWMSGAAGANRLYYAYRGDSSTYYFSVYDFSPGVDQNGVEAMADPVSRKPYGWSTACLIDSDNAEFGPRAMGAVLTSTGVQVFAALNDNHGAKDGRIDKMLYGATDNGSSIPGSVYGKRYLAAPETRFSPQAVGTVHASSYSGPTIYLLNTMGGASAGNTVAVSSSGSDEVAVDMLQFPQTHRSPTKVAQMFWFDSEASTGAILWQMDIVVEVLQKVGG